MRAAWLALLLVPACAPEPGIVAGYDLRRPVRTFELPEDLKEVSSIVAVGGDVLACLQDEKGWLFFFDLGTGAVTERVKFGKRGDYEGLAFRGGTFWVLRSDGRVMRLERDEDRYRVSDDKRAKVGHDEFEGLTWDARLGQLLLAPKDRPQGREHKGTRRLFLVDPETLETAETPWLALDLDPIRRAIAGGEGLELRFSEVAVHADTGRVWLLSAADHAVLVLERDGRLAGFWRFSKDLLPQPEGATFLPDGRLVLASEGVGGPARLCVFAPAGR